MIQTQTKQDYEQVLDRLLSELEQEFFEHCQNWPNNIERFFWSSKNLDDFLEAAKFGKNKQYHSHIIKWLEIIFNKAPYCSDHICKLLKQVYNSLPDSSKYNTWLREKKSMSTVLDALPHISAELTRNIIADQIANAKATGKHSNNAGRLIYSLYKALCNQTADIDISLLQQWLTLGIKLENWTSFRTIKCKTKQQYDSLIGVGINLIDLPKSIKQEQSKSQIENPSATHAIFLTRPNDDRRAAMEFYKRLIKSKHPECYNMYAEWICVASWNYQTEPTLRAALNDVLTHIDEPEKVIEKTFNIADTKGMRGTMISALIKRINKMK